MFSMWTEGSLHNIIQEEGGELLRWKNVTREGVENAKVGAQRQPAQGTKPWKWAAGRLLASSVTELVALLSSCCASFSLWLTPPFSSFPQKNMCLGKAMLHVPREPLARSFESVEHYRREVIMLHSIKTRVCKLNCLCFLELQGIIHTKQWWFFR